MKEQSMSEFDVNSARKKKVNLFYLFLSLNKKNEKQELEARMTKVISDYTAQLTERTEHHMG
jgi:hypothetical protein